jgi:hypothetical protein
MVDDKNEEVVDMDEVSKNEDTEIPEDADKEPDSSIKSTDEDEIDDDDEEEVITETL